MADSSGPPQDAVERMAALRQLEAEPWRYDFFAAVRLFEVLFPEKPLVGRARLPRHEALRLASTVRMAHANSTVAELDLSRGVDRPKLRTHFLGLLGPNGPMPLHLTEYAFNRANSHDDDTLIEFLDIFNHRVLSLFYRAWSDALPTAQAGRSDDRFGHYLNSFLGVNLKAALERDAFNDEAKKHLSGLLAQQRKSAENLERALQSEFAVEVTIDQLQGQWAEFDPVDCTVLGPVERQNRLGVSSVIGRRAWLVQSKFTVRLGPMPLRQFVRFLPGQAHFRALVAAVRLYTTDEFDWDLRLVLVKDEVPVSRLGRQGRLGMTSWLGQYDKSTDSDEVKFRPDLKSALN